MGCGLVAFFMQFETRAFPLMQHSWTVLEDEDMPEAVRWEVLCSEFLSIICLFPLLRINFRLGVSEVVSC